MFKYNTDNIFAGYIKQLLASFNLPTYKIYSKANSRYLEENGTESPEIFETVNSGTQKYKQHLHHFSYIKNGGIYKYVYTEASPADTLPTAAYGTYNWQQITSFYPGQKLLNHTKNLKIKNNIYDTYTHEYLGNYLRFFRDYDNINLMPLYNCFSNNLCDNLLIDYSAETNITRFRFDSDDTKYKIYMVPVKLFQEYTIAIDCDTEIEMCCGFFSKYYTNSSVYTLFPQDTYRRYTQTKFNQPILFTALKDIFYKENQLRINLLDLAKNEDELKLFIKIPANNKSSITILEGNYLNYNDTIRLAEKDAQSNIEQNYYQNHTITNFENEAKTDFITAQEFYEKRNFKPITRLELLTLNTGESYPFATKLIEYLVGNVVTELDETPDNIARVQKIISDWSDGEITGLHGVWDPRLQAALYEGMTKYLAADQTNHDVFGYVDKTTESKFSAYDRWADKTNTIANVDLYEDLYLALKDIQ